MQRPESELRTVIDRLRKEIQDRLDQLLAEAEKLRGALAALDPRASRPRAEPTRESTAGQPRTPAAASATASARKSSGKRAAPGGARTKILAALSGGNAMTAGEVATATGLGRGSVSTTLSKLAKSGEVQKAQRGYRLPNAAS